MLTTTTRIYCLPGWGFKSAMFERLAHKNIDFIGIDYHHMPARSLTSLARSISKQLPTPCLLLGWSLGGLIAIKIAALFPRQIQALILVASHPRPTADPCWVGISHMQRQQFLRRFAINPKKHMERFFQLVCFPSLSSDQPISLRRYLFCHEIRSLLPLLTILFNSDLRQEYQQLGTETIHVINDHDAVLPHDKSQLITLNPRVHIVHCDNAGHAHFFTHPEHYYSTIEAFIHGTKPDQTNHSESI